MYEDVSVKCILCFRGWKELCEMTSGYGECHKIMADFANVRFVAFAFTKLDYRCEIDVQYLL